MPEKPPSTSRLEAFSDGVIAVIITIMVLELKVPHEAGLAGIRAVVPSLLVYLISFCFTGIYWFNHQHLLERIERADRRILYANLSFLFFLSLLPFFTSYLMEKGIDTFAVILYSVSMMVTGFAFLLLRLAVHRDLRRSGNLAEEDTAQRGKHLASLAMYLASVPVAMFWPRLALIIVAMVTVIWIVPNFAIGKSKRPV